MKLEKGDVLKLGDCIVHIYDIYADDEETQKKPALPVYSSKEKSINKFKYSPLRKE